jgi:ABC-type transport system involved in multi-copper enzyme maturation permease subunit
MLSYKAWLESRARFAVSAIALGWLCTVYVVWQPARADAQPPVGYRAYISHAVYGSVLPSLFVGCVLVLGLGGLLQEKARGTADFTLALPLRRGRHVAARAAVGLIETSALALLPMAFVCAGSWLVGESYPLARALHFSVLWAAAGGVVFAAALLLSTLVAGEYSAPVACFVALFLYIAIVNMPPLDRVPSLNVLAVMSLTGPVPWPALTGMVLAALGLIAIGRAVTERQEF